MPSRMNAPQNRVAPVIWLRRTLLAGGVACAAWLSVKIVIALTAPESLWEPVDMSGPVMASAVAPVAYDFSYNPFVAGDAAVVDTAPVVMSDDAPETTLDLRLTGLRAGTNGSAYIRTPNGNEDNYYIDEEIMSGVILRGVQPTFVLIDVNGQAQRLTTEDAKAARRGTGGAALPTRTASLSTLQTLTPETFLSQVRIVPATGANGARIGVSVQPRSAGVDLSDYGLRAGDVITRFAGQSLSGGLPDVAALSRTASSGRAVSVDLIRDGKPMTITIGSGS